MVKSPIIQRLIKIIEGLSLTESLKFPLPNSSLLTYLCGASSRYFSVCLHINKNKSFGRQFHESQTELQICFMVEDDLELLSLLPLPDFWHYWHELADKVYEH